MAARANLNIMAVAANGDPTDENTLVFKFHVKHEGNSKKKGKTSKSTPTTMDGMCR